jgi:hypothetical protein
MGVTNFNVLISCPKDELHQWFKGLYGEHNIPAIVHRYTKVLHYLPLLSFSIKLVCVQRPDLVQRDKNGEAHPIMSNEAVARVFKGLGDSLQGVVSDTSRMTITPEFSATFWRCMSRRQRVQNLQETGSVFSC